MLTGKLNGVLGARSGPLKSVRSAGKPALRTANGSVMKRGKSSAVATAADRPAGSEDLAVRLPVSAAQRRVKCVVALPGSGGADVASPADRSHLSLTLGKYV